MLFSINCRGKQYRPTTATSWGCLSWGSLRFLAWRSRVADLSSMLHPLKRYIPRQSSSTSSSPGAGICKVQKPSEQIRLFFFFINNHTLSWPYTYNSWVRLSIGLHQNSRRNTINQRASEEIPPSSHFIHKMSFPTNHSHSSRTPYVRPHLERPKTHATATNTCHSYYLRCRTTMSVTVGNVMQWVTG